MKFIISSPYTFSKKKYIKSLKFDFLLCLILFLVRLFFLVLNWVLNKRQI